MAQLEIEKVLDAAPDTVIYRLRGHLGEASPSFDLLDDIRLQVQEGPARIVLSMEHVAFVTSVGVGLIAACYTSAKNAGKSFVLAAVPKQARRVLEICGILSLVENHDTEADALAGS